jgi:L-glyceraldehyde 3-phosphate reductase
MNWRASDTRYDRDIWRRCGRSGLKLPLVSLGLWQNFGLRDDAAMGRALVLRAFDLGITHFDLANNYGPPPGAAETALGKILADDLRGYRDELIISTKAGYLMWPGPYGEWGSRKHLLASLDQSLGRMRLEHVDIFYSHRFDPQTPLEETVSALVHAVRAGKAIYAGISNYPPAEAGRAIALLRAAGVGCLIHQASYSLLNRAIESGLLPLLAREGVGCIAYSPLAQGLLTSRYLAGVPPDSRAGRGGSLAREKLQAAVPRARLLNELAAARGQTLAQMSLAWVLREPTVTSALIGASRVSQLEENLAATANLVFSDDELAAIDRALIG